MYLLVLVLEQFTPWKVHYIVPEAQIKARRRKYVPCRSMITCTHFVVSSFKHEALELLSSELLITATIGTLRLCRNYCHDHCHGYCHRLMLANPVHFK